MGSTVAARLESLAEPGGIRVSRDVRDQVRDRLDQRSWKAASHFTGDQRFDSRLLQEEKVKPISNYVDLTRRAGTQLLLLKERWPTWGPTGDKAVASVPSAK
jgi:class 3 adenylate cyclase